MSHRLLEATLFLLLFLFFFSVAVFCLPHLDSKFTGVESFSPVYWFLPSASNNAWHTVGACEVDVTLL